MQTGLFVIILVPSVSFSARPSQMQKVFCAVLYSLIRVVAACHPGTE